MKKIFCSFCNANVNPRGHINPCPSCGGQLHHLRSVKECAACGRKFSVEQSKIADLSDAGKSEAPTKFIPPVP